MSSQEKGVHQVLGEPRGRARDPEQDTHRRAQVPQGALLPDRRHHADCSLVPIHTHTHAHAQKLTIKSTAYYLLLRLTFLTRTYTNEKQKMNRTEHVVSLASDGKKFTIGICFFFDFAYCLFFLLVSCDDLLLVE